MAPMPTVRFRQSQIKALREGLGLTQEEFGRRLGVTRQAVSAWESGEVKPTIDSIAKMAGEFGAKIESFWMVEPVRTGAPR
jgi:transcriptional regulator with XRE-family HTH domain